MTYPTTQDEKIQERIQEITAELAKVLNNISLTPTHAGAMLAAAINRQHRTIQQHMIGTMVNAILWYANNAQTDARNIDAKMLASQIMEGLQDSKYFDLNHVVLPFI